MATEEKVPPPVKENPDISELKRRVKQLEEKKIVARVPQDLDAVVVRVTTSQTADSVEAARHNLKRQPTGYLVVRQHGTGDVYEDNAVPAWTEERLFFKCSGSAVELTLLVF